MSKIESIIGKQLIKYIGYFFRVFLIVLFIVSVIFAFTGQRPNDYLFKSKTTTFQLELLEKEVKNIKQDISYQNKIIDYQFSIIEQKQKKIQELEEKIDKLKKKIDKETIKEEID